MQKAGTKKWDVDAWRLVAEGGYSRVEGGCWIFDAGDGILINEKRLRIDTLTFRNFLIPVIKIDFFWLSTTIDSFEHHTCFIRYRRPWTSELLLTAPQS